LRYDGVSLTSDSASYRIELGSVANFSPKIVQEILNLNVYAVKEESLFNPS